ERLRVVLTVRRLSWPQRPPRCPGTRRPLAQNGPARIAGNAHRGTAATHPGAHAPLPPALNGPRGGIHPPPLSRRADRRPSCQGGSLPVGGSIPYRANLRVVDLAARTVIAHAESALYG